MAKAALYCARHSHPPNPERAETTQRDLAKARYDVLVNSLRLRQASGQLAPSDVDSVNRLLAK